MNSALTFFCRHQGTKTLRKNNKIKSFVPARHRLCLRRGGRVFVPWWQIYLGSGPSASLRLAGGRAYPGLIWKKTPVSQPITSNGAICAVSMPTLQRSTLWMEAAELFCHSGATNLKNM